MVVEQWTRSGRRALGLILLASACSAGSLFAQSPTFARTDYPLLGNTHIVVDLNGDGRLDLAAPGINSARVMLGNGDGTFQPFIEFPVAGQTQDIAAGDFNGDGNVDLAVTINDPQISLSLMTGNGNGTFNAATNFPNTSGFDSPSIVATDLDNDGLLDVVIGHDVACFTAPCIAADNITVMRGNGNGTFQPAQEITIGQGFGAAEIAVGDFNRDGIKDLAIASSSARVAILLGVGNGTFTQQTLTLDPEPNLGEDNTDVDVADFNRDTIEDLVVALSLNGSRTVILLGNGNGTFGAPAQIQEPGLRVPQYQAVADYNGDSLLDLAISLANGSEGLMEIRNGNGDGTFGPLVLYLKPPDKSSLGGGKIAHGDFNADGKPDIALVQGGAAHALIVLRNTTGQAPPPTPAAPTLVSPTNQATVSQPVTLDWTNVANATRYEVQVDDSSTMAAPFVRNLEVSVSHVTLSSLPPQRLFWRVRAANSAGVFGPFSSTWRFTPQVATAPASLSAVSVSPPSVTGGTGATGTATLTSGAPSGGAVVSLSSSNTAVASVPTSVTVPAGSTSATFAVSTSAVATSTPVTIAAAYAGITRATTLTVNPPGQTATLTVTATGRSGERVTSSPAGINVSVGTTGSASFNVGTSITLSVTNSRDAIWSGACSSGGNKTKTCTFTLNANASVTANVQ